MAVRALVLCTCTLLLLSGCLSRSAPPAASSPGQSAMAATSNATAPVVTKTLAGTLLVRVPGSGAIPLDGDSPAFCFDLPEDQEMLSGRLTWSPSEPMGLEFQYHGRVMSSYDSPLQNTTPPIDLAVNFPAGGHWFAYAGPGAAGTAIQWSLTLTVKGQAGAAPWDGKVTPDGNALGGTAC